MVAGKQLSLVVDIVAHRASNLSLELLQRLISGLYAFLHHLELFVIRPILVFRDACAVETYATGRKVGGNRDSKICCIKYENVNASDTEIEQLALPAERREENLHDTISPYLFVLRREDVM